MQRKDVLTQATARVDLEDTALSDISQSQKGTYCVVPLARGPQQSHIYRAEGRESAPKDEN